MCARTCVCVRVCTSVINNGNLRRKSSRWKASKFFNIIANQKQAHTHRVREKERNGHVLFFSFSLTSAFSCRMATRDTCIYKLLRGFLNEMIWLKVPLIMSQIWLFESQTKFTAVAWKCLLLLSTFKTIIIHQLCWVEFVYLSKWFQSVTRFFFPPILCSLGSCWFSTLLSVCRLFNGWAYLPQRQWVHTYHICICIVLVFVVAVAVDVGFKIGFYYLGPF